MVPKVGLEPTRACAHCALNAARLPIPPLRRVTSYYFSTGLSKSQFPDSAVEQSFAVN
jgi:hypothetical protein